MIRFILIMFLPMAMAGLVASDVDPLMRVTGAEFGKTLDGLVGDAALVSRLRGSPVVGASGHELRQELLRRLVLARADSPESFASFNDLLALMRPDSPMLEVGWWDRVASSGRVLPDESLLRGAMDKWMKTPPANAEEWIKLYREVSPTVSTPDAKRMLYRYWPAIAYGLSGDPSKLRKMMIPAFGTWCEEEGYGELQLESLWWFCERSDYESTVVGCYSTLLHAGINGSKGDKGHLVARRLSMLEAGERFIKADNKPGINDRLDSAEKFGSAANAPVLRRLADMPVWSAYRDRMLQVADKLEKAGDKPKER